ncbi:MAG: response regulator [Opitutales bacterium]
MNQNPHSAPAGSLTAGLAMSHFRKPRILVVDDQPVNITLLERKLKLEGMEVASALDGPTCLAMVPDFRPDVILLDVMMPGMDGYEVCSRLHAAEETKDIPVIFITASVSKEGRLHGLESGAVDYITKPIDLEETTARVRTQISLRRTYRENVDLQRRLGESRRSAAVGAVTQGVAHNLNNLLGVLVGYVDLLKIGIADPEKVKRSVNLMETSVRRMVEIISKLSSIASEESFDLIGTNLGTLLDSSITRFRNEQDFDGDVPIINNLPPDYTFSTNTEVFESILERLLTNAWESYLPEAPEKPVWIEVELSDDDEAYRQLFVRIHDRGEGISGEVSENLFDPFITTKVTVGRGLGLTMARHAARNLGGDLNVAEKTDGGVCATLWFPAS